ncbi:MAG: carbohydrate binding domain-containing protein [Candidatus Poribacteria bacterium]
MKWLSVFLIIFILMLSVSLEAFAAKWAKGENRIRNSTFEKDTFGAGPAEWNLEDGKCCDRGADYSWMVDDSTAHTGKKSLKIVGNKASGTDWHAKVRHMNSSMESGRKFTIAFWAKVDAKDGKSRNVTTSVQMQHDPWTGYHSVKIFLESTDWVEYFDTFDATADVDADMWVALSIAESDVDFWIDDFRFFEGSPKDEKGADLPKIAVNHNEKLTVTWGKIKSDNR